MKNINELPRIDCDVFVADNTCLCIGDTVKITGYFYAGDNCQFFGEIDAESGVYIGNDVVAMKICSKGDVIIGDFSDILEVTTKGNVRVGDYTIVHLLETDGNVFLGYKSESDNFIASDVLVEKRIPFKKIFRRLRQWWKWKSR